MDFSEKTLKAVNLFLCKQDCKTHSVAHICSIVANRQTNRHLFHIVSPTCTYTHSVLLLLFMFHITPVSCTAVSSTWSHSAQYDGMMCQKQPQTLSSLILLHILYIVHNMSIMQSSVCPSYIRSHEI